MRRQDITKSVRKYGILIAFILIMTITASGCRSYAPEIPANAGDNSKELERVLKHYEQEDTTALKLEAARWLIDNMRWHTSEESGVVLPDAAIIGYDFLVEHIDHAFKVWRESPFARNLDFDEFKEYILPYRAIEGFGNHATGAERVKWMERHIGLPDTLTTITEWWYHYCVAVINLRAEGGKSNAVFRSGLDDLLHNDFIDCSDKVNQCCLNLRALGIPCVAEHTIGYRTKRAHHFNGALYDAETGEWIRFDAEEANYPPGRGDWASPELLNLYRLTYAPSKDMPGYIDRHIAPGFESPCLEDVSNHTLTIEVEIDSPVEGLRPYLATFNRESGGLKPFTFGHIKENRAIFNRAIPTVWYVVTVYPEGEEKIISRPFLVTERSDGSGVPLYLDFTPKGGTERVVITRKYPVKAKLVERTAALTGTRVEGSDRADFVGAKEIWRLTKTPAPRMTVYPFDHTSPYRYYRLTTPGRCDIGEVRWLSGDKRYKPTGGGLRAYDGDMTTAPNDSTPITICFDKPTLLTGLELAPLNADNQVSAGHNYRLLNWDSDGWREVKKFTATTDSIVVEEVPAGTLLWLRDMTNGKEEMPFAWIDNRQVFMYPELYEIIITNNLLTP